jgi:hypothetical protein
VFPVSYRVPEEYPHLIWIKLLRKPVNTYRNHSCYNHVQVLWCSVLVAVRILIPNLFKITWVTLIFLFWVSRLRYILSEYVMWHWQPRPPWAKSSSTEQVTAEQEISYYSPRNSQSWPRKPASDLYPKSDQSNSQLHLFPSHAIYYHPSTYGYSERGRSLQVFQLKLCTYLPLCVLHSLFISQWNTWLEGNLLSGQ